MRVRLERGMRYSLTEAAIRLANEEADRTETMSASARCFPNTSSHDRRTNRLYSAGGELAVAHWLYGEHLPTTKDPHPDVRMLDGTNRTVDAKTRPRRFASLQLNTELYVRCDLYMQLYLEAFPHYEWRGYATHDELCRTENIQKMPSKSRPWAYVLYHDQLHDSFEFELP